MHYNVLQLRFNADRTGKTVDDILLRRLKFTARTLGRCRLLQTMIG
jgi:hypothetical protein